MISKVIIEEKLNLVADKMMVMKNNGIKENYPISLIDINCWEWPQGVGIFGLYKYYRQTGKAQIRDFLVHWYDSRMKEGIPEKNVNTTAPMLALTCLYEETNRKEYLDLIREWCDWIMKDKKLIRTGDGCFQHMITGDPNDNEILIDTIFMTLLFLQRAGKLLNRQEYIEEANYQIMTHVKYLLNKREGLFYHGFNFKEKNNYGEIMWGRGNCWYTVAMMEMIQEIPFDPSVSRFLLTVYRNQVQALKKYWDREKHLWHTVIDDPESYIEISASAGFLCGMMQGIRYQILDRAEYEELVEKALAALLTYIQKDGTVTNVSYGTPIGEDAAFYKSIPCCPMTYGQALVILLLQEAMEQYWHEAIRD